VGRVSASIPRLAPEAPVKQLLEKGLLTATDDSTVRMSDAVADYLAGREYFDTTSLTAPVFDQKRHDPTDVDGAGAGEAMELLRAAETLVGALSADPPPALAASGGVGARELKRLSKESGIAVERVGFVLELLAAARLVGRGLPQTLAGSRKLYWAPTPKIDRWLADSAPAKWAAVASSWLPLDRVPSFAGAVGEDGKVTPALTDETYSSPGRKARRQLLERLDALPPGSSLTRDQLLATVHWYHPHMGRGAGYYDFAIAEAAALGVTARGAITRPGRALFAGADAAPAMAAAMPAPIDYVLVQADLTIVAPGTLEPALAEKISLVADLESAGGASVYRISESSILRALDFGMTAAELHALFDQHSTTPTPQALAYLIDDVARRHGRLRAGAATSFVRCDDPALMGEVLASKAGESLELRALAPTVAISAKPLAEVLEALKLAGFAPAGEDAVGAMISARESAARVSTPRRDRPYVFQAPTREQLEGVVARLREAQAARDAAAASTHEAVTNPTEIRAALAEAIDEGKQVVLSVRGNPGPEEHLVRPFALRGGMLLVSDDERGLLGDVAVHEVLSVRPL
jgi:hypothetical protein